MAQFDDDFATFFMLRRVDDIICGILACEVCDKVVPITLDRLDLVEQFDEVRARPIIRVHRPQECHRRELAALVDTNPKRVSLTDDDFDPASTLGNHTARKLFAFARLGTLNEVDPGRSMQLTDNDTFGTVDDEFAAADHDRHVAKVNFLFNRLLFHQSQPDPKRTTEC